MPVWPALLLDDPLGEDHHMGSLAAEMKHLVSEVAELSLAFPGIDPPVQDHQRLAFGGPDQAAERCEERPMGGFHLTQAGRNRGGPPHTISR